MPKYKVSFEYETEVVADNKEDAILHVGENWTCEYIGSQAVAEEIKDETIS